MNELNAQFHHLGVAVPRLDESCAGFQKLFGYEVTGGPYVDPIQKVEVCFLSLSGRESPVIELVAPTQQDSPIAKYLQKRIGGYHACYRVADLDQSIDKARGAGCILIGEPVPAVAFNGRRICWLFTPMQLLVELVELD